MSAADVSIPNHLNMKGYSDIYELYVIDVSFLWVLRSLACEHPHYYANDIGDLEVRINLILDALMTSLDMGWQACDNALALEEPGEVFTAMVIAMRSHEPRNIQQAVDVGLANLRTLPGLISAIGWLPDKIADIWIDRFLNGKQLDYKYLGLASCSVRRRDPGKILSTILNREDCIQDERLYARGLRLVGELRRQDCMPAVIQATTSGNKTVRFWANWAAVLLGHRASVNELKPYVFNPGPYQIIAIQLVFRCLPVDKAREWISEMSTKENLVRFVIKATGILGDPHAINWLITKMQNPLLAKLAGEAFSNITGVDFEKHQIITEAPENTLDIPNDEVDDLNVDMDEDENLPFPDVEKVAELWRKYGQNFLVGRRYFMGKAITADILKDKLKNGTQTQRHAAALELALNETDTPLFNTRARVTGF